jgi:hypothetical protein
MREFERQTGRLRGLPLASRVVYSGFLLFVLIGLVVSVLLAREMVGLDLAGVDEYYAGEVPLPDEGNHSTAGPAMDLPPELDEQVEPEPRSLRATLEVTHFHLFSMPLHWMVLAHLFAMSTFRRFRTTIIVGGALALTAHLLAPWVARTGSAWSKTFYAGSGILMGTFFLIMALVPLVEMWRPKRAAGEGGA